MMYMHMYVCVCVRACARVCVCVCARVRVCVCYVCVMRVFWVEGGVYVFVCVCVFVCKRVSSTQTRKPSTQTRTRKQLLCVTTRDANTPLKHTWIHFKPFVAPPVHVGAPGSGSVAVKGEGTLVFSFPRTC